MKNTGSHSEQEFQRKMKRYHGKKCKIYKVTDTKEVRGRSGSGSTKKQPCDFMVTELGVMYYCEVKSSQNKTSFPFSNIKPHQFTAAKSQLLAGGYYTFMLHNLNTNTWYDVPAYIILSLRSEGKQSIKWDELNDLIWELNDV